MAWEVYGKEIMIVSVAVLIVIISRHVMRWFMKDEYLKLKDTAKRHKWGPIETLSKSCRCSKCDILLIAGEGYICENCGLACDLPCLCLLEKECFCKSISISTSNKEFKHHWIKGGSILSDAEYQCNACKRDCNFEDEFEIQCCWCQRIFHASCQSKVDEVCDFGNFRKLIVPPFCIDMCKRSRLSNSLILKSVSNPGWDDWNPVIVVANQKAGNSDGSIILSYFRRVLNPCQVVDLSEYSPSVVANWCTLLNGNAQNVTVLVGGGDGTISWVLSTLYEAKLELQPSIGVIPLGTGNDLSRVLGWGNEYDRKISPSLYLGALSSCRSIQLDRWELCTKPFTRRQRLRHPRSYKTLYFYNYFSIGVDAKVAFDFHCTRQSPFYLFQNRVFNKLLYLCFGTQQAVGAECKGLQDKIELYLNGEKVDLPELESVVVLNINSWAAGVDLWSSCKNNSAAELDDEKFEVVGLYSSLHIAQIRMGFASPHFIGQGNNLKIILKADMPVQTDGEPWIQRPGEMCIRYVDKAKVLKVMEPL